MIVGQPISLTYKNALWRSFIFGSLGPWSNPQDWIANRYDLHVTSVWRIERKASVVVGFADSFEPPPGMDSVTFENQSYPKYTHQEVLLTDIFGRYNPEYFFIYDDTESMIVSRAVFDTIGDLVIDFGDNYRLRVFVDASTGSCWRLRPPESVALPHLVVDAHEKLGLPEWLGV